MQIKPAAKKLPKVKDEVDPAVAAEDSDPEGSEVSYDSDPAAQPEGSGSESDAGQC